MMGEIDELSQEVRRRMLAAEGYCQLQMWQEAWDELEELPPELRAFPSVLIFRLEILVSMKRYESAAVLAESLISKGLKAKQAYLLGAYAVRRCRSISEAETLLLKGEEILKEDVLFHYNLACYASADGRLDAAKRRLHEAFKLDPSYRSIALHDEDLEPVWESLGSGL